MDALADRCRGDRRAAKTGIGTQAATQRLGVHPPLPPATPAVGLLGER